MVPPVPRGRARTLAPTEQSDFQPSWPPGPTAQRPLSTLRKPHPEKEVWGFFSAFSGKHDDTKAEGLDISSKRAQRSLHPGFEGCSSLLPPPQESTVQGCTVGSTSHAGAPSCQLCPPCKIHPLHITPTPRTSPSQLPASRSPSCFWSCNFLHFVKSKF